MATLHPPDGFDTATGHVWNGSEWVTFTADDGSDSGDTTDPPSVTTEGPTGISTDTVTFNGTLTDLGGHASVTCYFEWRPTTASTWNTTPSSSLSSTGSFAHDLDTILDPDTEYEYRAIGEADGDRDSGTTVTFTTDQAAITSIENFENGVNAAWVNDTEWGTTTQVAWSGSYAGYRSGTGSLRAGSTTFDAAFGQGGPFISMPFHSTTTGLATVDFGRDDSSTLAGYTIRADFQGSGTGDLRIGHRDSGDNDYTTLASASASLSANEWYHLVGLWHDEDTIHAWIYDSSGTEVASIDVIGEGETGDWWAVYTSPSDSTFVDDIQIRDDHPYTGTHYTAVPASTNEGSGGSGGDVSYDLEEPLDDSSWSDFFHDQWQSGNASIVDASGRAGNQLRVTLQSGSHYGVDLKHEHPTSVGYEPTACYQRFRMKFGDQWETADDGKMPGFAGVADSDAGTGGQEADGNAWTCRSGWNHGTSVGEGVPMEWYIYHLDTSNYGEHDHWDYQGSQFHAQPGTWYDVEQWLDLGSVNTNDAVLRTWVDGTLVYERTDLRFRQSGGHDIRELYWNVYHGGGTAAPTNCHVYFDDIQVNHGSMP